MHTRIREIRKLQPKEQRTQQAFADKLNISRSQLSYYESGTVTIPERSIKDICDKYNVEIIEDAIESGHKILLFSGYTQMFPLIEKELNKRFIEYYKLTGETKIDERIEMVDKFNKDPDVKIFLISLKAGGTGLNLTGADMVIHYDPWWNLSAENQATDRAYRIGQKNNVQVYKLITSNSIEEKIQELQEKKAKLIDDVLDTKQTFISKLSKDEIMSLFAE